MFKKYPPRVSNLGVGGLESMGPTIGLCKYVC
jgi:hypothetical protein